MVEDMSVVVNVMLFLISVMLPSLCLSPFLLTCSIMRFISLLLLGLCACVVCVVTWLSLDGL